MSETLLIETLVRRICHDLANPLAALRMELELGSTESALQPAVGALESRLQLVRHAISGTESAPADFARLVAQSFHHREAEVKFADDAAPRAMRAVALVLPAMAEHLGGRGHLSASATADGFSIRIEAPHNQPDDALRAALQGEVSPQSSFAPLALAAQLVGPIDIGEDGGSAVIHQRLDKG